MTELDTGDSALNSSTLLERSPARLVLLLLICPAQVKQGVACEQISYSSDVSHIVMRVVRICATLEQTVVIGSPIFHTIQLQQADRRFQQVVFKPKIFDLDP